jgi:hypothetical protein
VDPGRSRNFRGNCARLHCAAATIRSFSARGPLEDYVAQVRELLDFRRERRHVETRQVTPEPQQQSETASVLVIAARGVSDQAAAELVTHAIHFRLGIPVQCPSLGGLTGIAAIADSAGNKRSEFVALISVGEVTPAQLDLLLSRARRVFTRSTILLGCWGGETTQARLRDSGIERAETPASLVEVIGRLVAERVANRPSHLELV